jgi:hypothetical protein
VQGKYSFWIKLLFCLSAVLAITSYLVPATDGGEGWIPLLSGYADLTAFNGNLLLRGILGGVFNVLTVLSLLVINTKSVNNVFNPNLTVAFFLIILLLDPGAAYFNSLHPALLLFVWGQYCFISNRKFLSMFLLSSSALFYAPLILVLPLVLVISIIGASDMLRVAVKSLGGLLLPFLYVLSFRYMAFGDATVFIEEYINKRNGSTMSIATTQWLYVDEKIIEVIPRKENNPYQTPNFEIIINAIHNTIS